jgi:16S rRNA (cytosine1402-N4)-methyltransferase
MLSKNAQDDENPQQHVPVMLAEVLQALAPKDGGVYVDGTFGAGGYARAILERADCTVYAIDRDPEAFARATAMARDFPGRLIPKLGRFGAVRDILESCSVASVDGLVLDLGVSSPQLDDARRGFSFRRDGPLDMRMGHEGRSARDVVNGASEAELADIIYSYGEERASRRIAKRIVAARREKPIETTLELANIVHEALPMHGGMKTDTATRTFQALRIYVNDELGELDRALEAAETLLKTSGRLVVVSFHSLEDWRVKEFLRRHSGREARGSRHLPHVSQPGADAVPALFDVPERQGLKPTEEETARNPRARSARLRYGVRCDTEAAHA